MYSTEHIERYESSGTLSMHVEVIYPDPEN